MSTTDRPRYQLLYSCRTCGYEGHDSYADVYGAMSVPWGYLL